MSCDVSVVALLGRKRRDLKVYSDGGVMAKLLGSKYCIESLRGDVTDLHAVAVDVLSRVGPSASFRSWKYPDKISSDLDIPELLERYDYCEDEEERQVAHIVLMELVIDR